MRGFASIREYFPRMNFDPTIRIFNLPLFVIQGWLCYQFSEVNSLSTVHV